MVEQPKWLSMRSACSGSEPLKRIAADSKILPAGHRRLQGRAFTGIARLKISETGNESLIILQ